MFYLLYNASTVTKASVLLYADAEYIYSLDLKQEYLLPPISVLYLEDISIRIGLNKVHKVRRLRSAAALLSIETLNRVHVAHRTLGGFFQLIETDNRDLDPYDLCPKYLHMYIFLFHMYISKNPKPASSRRGVVSKWEESGERTKYQVPATFTAVVLRNQMGSRVPLFLSLRVYLLSPSEYASPSSRTYVPTVGRMQAPWFRLPGCVVFAGNEGARHFLRTRATHTNEHTGPTEREEKEKKRKREKEDGEREKTGQENRSPRSNNDRVLTECSAVGNIADTF